MTSRRLLFASFLLAALLPAAAAAESCEGLSKLGTPTASITIAKSTDKGSFASAEGAKTFSPLPAFCRVAATLKPTNDSEIRVEIWLPISDWNGKFMAVGSGGWGGSIAYAAMADALVRGYAVSATDDGHSGDSASFIVGHPEKFIDFAYRAEHEMTLEAKKVIQTFYGREARYSYWNGCSGGGREGLLQAYRYPDEFNGIIAGDPANVRRNGWALWLAIHAFSDPASYIPPAKYPMIHRAVLKACDAKDGLEDGLIDNPQNCHVDFKQLECRSTDGPDCLTHRQVATAQTIVSPATDANGKVFFPRLEPGTELAWARLAGGPRPADLFLDQFRYLVHHDPNWDWRSFDLEKDVAKANAINKDVDELNPNLGPFAKQGGKLLIYHGWSDQQVAPGSSIEFYKSVLNYSAHAAPSSEWIRLFMVPGMGHCSGGEGPNAFDKVSAMEQWVEKGVAPAQIVASHRTDGRVDRSRPLCPYPQVARYRHTGSSDDAANFSCELPPGKS